MNVSKNRFRSIQSLRGIAALMVMLFHLNNTFAIGATGVQIFFVISGFIMGTIGLNETPSEFIIKRAIRILPLYWIVTLGMCALALLPGTFSNFKFDAISITKSLFFIPFYDQTGHLWPLVVQGWTLNLEVIFYLLFAAGLIIKRPFLICSVALSGLMMLGFGSWHGAFANFYFTTAWFEFLAGLALSQWWTLIPKWISPLLLSVGLLTLAMMQSIKFEIIGLKELSFGLCALCIVAGSLVIEKKIGWSKLMRPLEVVGDWSFSLYLLHTFPIHALYKIFGENIISAVTAAAIALLGSYLSYNFVENRFSKFLRKNLVIN